MAVLGNLESRSLVEGCSIIAEPINGDVALRTPFNPMGPCPEDEPEGEILPFPLADADDGNPNPRPWVTSFAIDDDDDDDMVGAVDLKPPGEPMWNVIGTGPLEPSRSSVRPKSVVTRPGTPEPEADLVISAAACRVAVTECGDAGEPGEKGEPGKEAMSGDSPPKAVGDIGIRPLPFCR